MPEAADAQITELLARMDVDRADAVAALLPIVYDELRRIAAGVFRRASPASTLQPTAIVHEAWMKLAGGAGGGMVGLENRRHFFAVAAKAMRQVLADHARAQRRQKRGGGAHRVTLDEHATPDRSSPAFTGFDIVAFDDSLRRLTELNARHAEVVELRVLGGMTVDETATHLGVSPRTIASDWVMARTWLRTELRSGH